MLKNCYCKSNNWLKRHSMFAWIFLASVVISGPPLGAFFQQRMSTHMLIQMPLLVALGIWGGRIWRRQAIAEGRTVHMIRVYRASGILLAIFSLMTWMIPRMLDWAVESASVDALKVFSLVCFAGIPLGLCWPEIGGAVRGVVHLEALATLARMGWIYLETPQRLCSRYGLDEQRLTGQLLLILALIYTLYLLFIVCQGLPVEARTAARP